MAVVGTESTSVKYAHGVLTVTALNALAQIVIPAKAGVQFIVDDGWMRSTGAADTATSVDWSDGTNTICAFTVAGLTDGAILRVGTAVTAVGTNLGLACVVNKPIKVKTTGGNVGTATAIEYYVKYHEARIT